MKAPIFFIIHGLPMGGAEKFLISLINHIESELGNAVLILLSEDKTLLKEVAEGIEVITLKKRFRFDPGLVIALSRLYKKRKPSKIFCVNGYSFFMAKIASLGINDLTFYLSPHTTVAFSLKYEILSKLFFSFFGKRDIAIFLCKYQMWYMRKKYLSDRGYSTIIYNGIDTNYFNPKKVDESIKMSVRKEFNIGENDMLILSVARISNEKGHIYALEALYLLHDIYDIKAHILFVGDGDQEIMLQLRKFVNEKNLSRFVHFAGKQNDVRPFYMACNVFTLASISETFSLSALEAMALGKPCVLTEVGGAREMIQPHLNGLLAKSMEPSSIARAWKHLLTRPELNPREIRSNMRNKFDIEDMLRRYMNIFKSGNIPAIK